MPISPYQLTLQQQIAAPAYGTSPCVLHSAPLLPDEYAESRQLYSQIPRHSNVSLHHKSTLSVMSSGAQTSHNLQYQPRLLEGCSVGPPTSDEDRTVSGDTERIPTPDLDEIVKGIFSRNQNFPGLTREQLPRLGHTNLYGQPLSSSQPCHFQL
jgi:hypothetical protein